MEGSAITMSSALESFFAVIGTVMTTVTGNTVLMCMFCAPIAFVAISAVKKLRGGRRR